MHAFGTIRGVQRLATLLLALPTSLLFSATPCAAQVVDATSTAPTQRIAINGQKLGGFVLPSQPLDGNLALSATKASRWKVDDTQRLLLEGEVRFKLGSYHITAKRALVWINRLPTANGVVTQVAAWFERAEEPARRAGSGASGKDLLITGSFLGETRISLVVGTEQAPASSAFVKAGEARLASYLRQLAAGSQGLSSQPLMHIAPTIPEQPLRVGDASLPAIVAADAGLPTSIEVRSPRVDVPIFQPDGTIAFSANSLVLDESKDRVLLTGHVEIEYATGASRYGQTLQLRAERGVVFLAPGAFASLRNNSRSLNADQIAGIYLEGAVQATDGSYTIRGAQIYYDLANNRAMIIDAVLRTFDRRRGDLPLYARAAELRQVAADEWQSDFATISTSAFFTPHLSIGVDKVTVTQQTDEEGGGMYVRSEGAAIQVGGKRILPLPGFEGPVTTPAIRGIKTGYEEYKGLQISTEWDLMQLLAMKPVDGLDAELTVEAFSERGPGVGTILKFSENMTVGKLDAYALYDFGGTDLTSAGIEVEQDAAMRGILEGESTTDFSEDAFVQTQLSAISDETFVTTWRERDFDQRREYETSVYFADTADNSSLSLLMKYDLNDFISNSYLLASRGYYVNKVPEFDYSRYGDKPLAWLTWTQTWSATMMSLNPTQGTPNSLGVYAGTFPGVTPTTDIFDAYEAAGYQNNWVSRLYTRHEFSTPFSSETANFTPFISADGTGYVSDEFTEYSQDASNLRALFAIGARMSARFTRVDDAAQNKLLDIYRLRHILEPYSTLWAGYDSVGNGDMPVYDQIIEGESGGAAMQLGLRQTLQTQRGGPGAWQSVDWLKLDTGLVVNDAGSEFQTDPVNPLHYAQSPIPQFYSWRPELSQWGSNAYGTMTWALSDALTLGGTATYLFEDRDNITNDEGLLPNLALGSLGVEMRHDPSLSTYLEYRYIAPTNSELLQLGMLYRVGKKYLIAFSPQYDFVYQDLRAISGSVSRAFPDFNLNLNASYDRIEDQAFFGMSMSIPAQSNTNPNGYSGSMRGF